MTNIIRTVACDFPIHAIEKKYHKKQHKNINESFTMNPSESGQMLDWLKIVHLDNLDLSFSSQTSSLSVKGMDIEMEWSFSGNLEFDQGNLG